MTATGVVVQIVTTEESAATSSTARIASEGQAARRAWLIMPKARPESTAVRVRPVWARASRLMPLCYRPIFLSSKGQS
jgi:hypothetical protein